MLDSFDRRRLRVGVDGSFDDDLVNMCPVLFKLGMRCFVKWSFIRLIELAMASSLMIFRSRLGTAAMKVNIEAASRPMQSSATFSLPCPFLNHYV